MKQTDYIRRFLAALMLLLFCFCNTPKRVLHDLLANHRDTQSTTHPPYGEYLASGFHCHTDDLVVISPFLPAVQNPNFLPYRISEMPFSEPLCVFHFGYLSGWANRGPPAPCFS